MNNTDTENPCGFCEYKSSKVLYHTYDTFSNHFCINQCNNYSAYFLSPPPSEELLSLVYDESYYGEGKEKFNESLIEKMLDYFRGKRADLVNKHLRVVERYLTLGVEMGVFYILLRHEGIIKSLGLKLKEGLLKEPPKYLVLILK